LPDAPGIVENAPALLTEQKSLGEHPPCARFCTQNKNTGTQNNNTGTQNNNAGTQNNHSGTQNNNTGTQNNHSGTQNNNAGANIGVILYAVVLL